MSVPDEISVLPPRQGDIWKDLDPRGGPTFVVEHVPDLPPCGPPYPPVRVDVRGTDGKRPRTVLLDRFRANSSYRTGYTLVSRPEQPDKAR